MCPLLLKTPNPKSWSDPSQLPSSCWQICSSISPVSWVDSIRVANPSCKTCNSLLSGCSEFDTVDSTKSFCTKLQSLVEAPKDRKNGACSEISPTSSISFSACSPDALLWMLGCSPRLSASSSSRRDATQAPVEWWRCAVQIQHTSGQYHMQGPP